jgi:hypothetical protein
MGTCARMLALFLYTGVVSGGASGRILALDVRTLGYHTRIFNAMYFHHI